MQELYNLGISENEIKNILESCQNNSELTNKEVYNKIELLKKIECNNKQIKNIIISNPHYLDRSEVDIINLIKKLIKIGIININILFDSNPYLLNKDSYEIDDYISQKLNEGKILEDIINNLEINPYLMDEI